MASTANDPASMANRDPEAAPPPSGAGVKDVGKKENRNIQQTPPMLTRLYHASTIAGLQSALRPAVWARSLYWWWYGHEYMPNIVKNYDVRPNLPVRIFFPSSYDQSSPTTLPTILTIHGGGMVIGTPSDDDAWSRTFSNTHNHLLISLNYSKSPWSPYPAPINDITSLILTIISDASLPMDKSRISLLGFSAGGNLALAAAQTKEIRGLSGLGYGIKACIPLYPILDFSIPASVKEARRYYKPPLKGARGVEYDYLAMVADTFDWAYIPYGQSRTDPLLSPMFSKREALPPHICVIGAELDILSHEAWTFASRMADRPLPSTDTPAGRPEPGPQKGALVPEGDERFGFMEWGEDEETGEVRTTKWILVPDALHGFDMHLPPSMVGDEEGWVDGNVKGRRVMGEIAGWLDGVVYPATREE